MKKNRVDKKKPQLPRLHWVQTSLINYVVNEALITNNFYKI